MKTPDQLGVQSWELRVSRQQTNSKLTRRGQTLVLVLWTMGLLSAAMGVLVMRSTQELRLGPIPYQSMQRRSLAEAAVWKAVAILKTDDPAVDHLQEAWADGVDPATQQALFTDVPLGEGRFSIGVMEQQNFVPGLIDEQRKLNLNTASTDSLKILIEQIGPAGADAEAMASAIVDWRDEPAGENCAEASPACHNALFESVDELFAVPGMTSELFTALRPQVTVYGDGKINVNTASTEVLIALGLDAQALIEQREHQPFEQPPEEGGSLLCVASTHFTVGVAAALNQAPGALLLDAVVDREGSILSWHPGQ